MSELIRDFLVVPDPDQKTAHRKMRPPATVMRLPRLGALHATRISFVRSLIRQMQREHWDIRIVHSDLDADGYGCLVYAIDTPHGSYSFVAFSHYLAPRMRTDRVIAEQWDTSFVLLDGAADAADIDRLRCNAPRQESGRFCARDLVLSRANKSVRLFDHVVDCLARGAQPDIHRVARVGYLLRTTAVYGNGKFGIADFGRLAHADPFAQPYRAEMLVVYLARQLSLDLVEHIASQRSPATATTLDPAVKRFLGVGNATGLGMAPFLVSHPKLINQWFGNRELALARVRSMAARASDLERFRALLDRARIHVTQINIGDPVQRERNGVLGSELQTLSERLESDPRWAQAPEFWDRLLVWAEHRASIETQELLVSLVIELYPGQVDELEENMACDDYLALDPAMRISALREVVETHYDWALGVDYDEPPQNHYFWYASAEKAEPRLGERANDPGAELEMPIGIAKMVSDLRRVLVALPSERGERSVAELLLEHPDLRGIVRRVQGLRDCPYAEIQDNLLGEWCLPIDILRCKLATFGASKFDPKSDRWTRITLFQGAPLPDELQRPDADDWAFPCIPVA